MMMLASDGCTTLTKRLEDLHLDVGLDRAPRLIMAFDCRRPLGRGVRMSLADVDEVLIGRGCERGWSRADRKLAISVLDPEVSRLHVRLARKGDGWALQDFGSKNGTLVGGVRTRRWTLSDGDLIEVGGSMFVYRDHAGDGGCAGDRDLAEEEDRDRPDVFRTLSLQLERRAADIERIAPTVVPVLVVGETGTGKELVAQAIHSLSGRRGPFVPVNCGALPRTLVESELFGYRRGAFSGAREDRPGLARKADGGTLFLDEVAELPEESQVALLRLLQEGEVRPVGSSELVRVDVRVIAATHQDIAARVDEGRFRRDLYARLAGYEMRVPPLRERREDIGSLIAALLCRLDRGGGELSLHPRAAAALFAHGYPMNVRELEQALAAAVALAPGGVIALEHLPRAMQTAAHSSQGSLGPEDEALRAELIGVLRQNRGNIRATARMLGKAPTQIRRWCRRLRVDPDEFRR
ncbi:MAG TPA: sigma 54-interacting transcriptional regulator [Kofleriaceae bacterium]|nr:sigma 54-interacting transcriptional regulator [Kofleriaceae bacterium]